MLALDVRVENERRGSGIFREFPLSIGRSSSSDFVLEAPGVWDRHLSIEIDEQSRSFVFQAESGAIVFHNGESASQGIIKNGDCLKIGGCHLWLTLSPTTQTPLLPAECVAWGLVLLAAGVQIFLLLALQK